MPDLGFNVIDKRFTPTRVGTIGSPASGTRCRAVHPHTRGDNVNWIHLLFLLLGSPPHAWGQFFQVHLAIEAARFTPTRVGTIKKTAVLIPPSSVHPHTRGDNIFRAMALSALDGSPPHAWGQLLRVVSMLRKRRFTPTRVGTIPYCPSIRSCIPVHPHTRGDNRTCVRRHNRHVGSPPHAWGQCE